MNQPFATITDVEEYYRNNILRYGLDAPRTLGYHSGPIDSRLLSNMLPEQVPDEFSVLDVGCGLGQIIPVLADRFPTAKLTSLLGIDLVDEFIIACKQRYPEYDFVTGDLLQWESDEKYDLVVAAGVFVSRIPEYEKYLHRVIAKMLLHTKLWVGFNVVTTQTETYTAKHLATISRSALQEILDCFPNVKWQIENKEVFPGSEDTFLCGQIDLVRGS